MVTSTASVMPEAIKEAIVTATQSAADICLDGVTAVLPIGLGVLGTFMGIRIAIRFFRSLVG